MRFKPIRFNTIIYSFRLLLMIFGLFLFFVRRKEFFMYCGNFKTQENQRFSAKKMKGYEIKFQNLRKLQYQRDKINYALCNFIADKIFAPYNMKYSSLLRLSVYQHILS